MPKKKEKLKVPFNKKGMTREEIRNSYNWGGPDAVTHLKEVEPFFDTMKYHGYETSSSNANHIMLVSLTTGLTYPVFMTDFHDMVLYMEKGVIRGTFDFVKRSSYYGLCFLGELSVKPMEPE